MTLQTMAASKDLQPFVRAYAEREVGLSPQPVVQRLPARLEQTLEIQFGRSFFFSRPGERPIEAHPLMVIGAVTQWGLITLPSNVKSFGIFFQPAGLSKLFSVPFHELTRSAYDGTAVIGGVLDTLRHRLAESGSFSERVRIVEAFLLRRAAALPCSTPSEAVAAHIFALKGVVSVAALAQQQGLGVRQFERRFRQYTGMPPKVYARIARFQTALDAKLQDPSRTWLHIAHALGYHDQMHMVRDFHDLAGGAPSHVATSIGDARPPASQLSIPFFA